MPKRFILHVDTFDEPRGWIWMIRTGRRRINAKHVTVNVKTRTTFKGKDARQPRAFIEGVGVLHDNGDGHIVISEA